METALIPQLKEDVKKVLEGVLAMYGLTFGGGITHQMSEYTIRMNIILRSNDKMLPEKSAVTSLTDRGLAAYHLHKGMPFMFLGNRYTVEKTRSGRYMPRVIAKDRKGKEYLFHVQDIPGSKYYSQSRPGHKINIY